MLLSLYNSSIAYMRQDTVLPLAVTQSYLCYTVHIHYTNVTVQVDRLHTALIEVVKTACECNADSSLYPKEWLFHFRWVNGKKKDVVPKDFYGNTIKFETVGSRTSAVVEAVVGKAKLKAAPAKANARKKCTTKDAASTANDDTATSVIEQEEAVVVKKARNPRAKKADSSSAAAVAIDSADASSETHSSKAVKSTGNKRTRAVKAEQDNADAIDSVATESKHFSKSKKRSSTDDTGTDTVSASDELQQPSKKKAAGKRTAKKSSGN
jgi:hypothetical protein